MKAIVGLCHTSITRIPRGNVKKGEVSSAAAYHLLAEVYLANKQYQEAATAASAVINNPALDLMTAWFGRRSTVTPGDVYWMLTLMRLGKWVERTRKYNPFYGTQMKDNYNLWPIPFGEIEKNNKAVLEQNPGYN